MAGFYDDCAGQFHVLRGPLGVQKALRGPLRGQFVAGSVRVALRGQFVQVSIDRSRGYRSCSVVGLALPKVPSLFFDKL